MTTTWYIRDRYAEFCKVLRRQTVQTLVHRRAQFEDDALQDVQSVQFIVKDVRQTSIKLSSSSNDSGSGVQDPLQLVSYSPRCVRIKLLLLLMVMTRTAMLIRLITGA